MLRYGYVKSKDFSKFLPPTKEKSTEMITIVCVCRQTYRKGIDLLVEVIPIVCREMRDVNFIIGGDGPKKYLIDKMVDTFGLHSKVETLGKIVK